MNDLISRRAAIEAVEEVHPLDYNAQAIVNRIKKIPSAQEHMLYGYKIEHLAYIARVMEKEEVTAEYAVKIFDDIGRAVEMIRDEVHEIVERGMKE